MQSPSEISSAAFLYRRIIFRSSVAVIFLSIFLSPLSFGQIRDVRFERLSPEPHLESIRIYDILQDRTGYMWFGTSTGLYRYDGYNFKHFGPRPSDSTSIAGLLVTRVYQDRTGNVWIGTFEGLLSRYDQSTERFYRITSGTSTVSLTGGTPIIDMLEDRSGNIWVASERAGVLAYDVGSRTIARYDSAEGLPGSTVNALCLSSSGTLWAGTEKGLAVFDRAMNRFDPIQISGAAQDIIESILCEGDTVLWIGTFDGTLGRLDLRTRTYTTFHDDVRSGLSFGNGTITSIAEAGGGYLWIGSGKKGLFKFDRHTDRFVNFVQDPKNPNSLSNDFVRRVFVDRTGVVWIGTESGGINKIGRMSEQIGLHRIADRDATRLPAKALQTDSHGVLWLGTANPTGLTSYDARDGSVGHYIRDRVVVDISISDGDLVWVGTWGEGVFRIDPKTKAVEAISWSNTYPSVSKNVVNVEVQGDSLLWIGLFKQGLLRYDVRSKSLSRFTHTPGDVSSLSSDRVNTLHRDSHGALWVGTDGGLNRLEPQSGEFKRYLHDGTRNSISHPNVLAILEDRTSSESAGRFFWIGARSGLDRLDAVTGAVEHVPLIDSVAPPSVVEIVSDNDGELWLSTGERGIVLLNPRTRESHPLTVEDGLQGSEFLFNAGSKFPSGEIVFGGMNGFNIFHPDTIKAIIKGQPPPVTLTAFSVFNRPFTLDSSLSVLKRIDLTYQQDFFSFEFAALDYNSPARNQFSFMLEGFDEQWNYSGRPYAGYTKVDPGSYTFHVRAATAPGAWSEQDASLMVVIAPPYWQTWWFRALVAAALLGLVAFAYNIRVRHLLALERLRLRVASDLHDDLGGVLSSLALSSDLVRRTLPDEQATSKNRLLEMGSVARTAADALRSIVWVIDPGHETMDEMVMAMRTTATRMLRNMEVSFSAGPMPVRRILDMEFRRNVALSFNEILNNILKHAHAGRVDINLRSEGERLVLRVHDDGTGFDTSQISPGNGLGNLQHRAAAVGGTCTLTSEPGKGTTVEIEGKIP